MSEDAPEYHDIDYTRIRFPSDRLDIGTMRRIHPSIFDIDQGPYEEALEVGSEHADAPTIGEMLAIERLIARNAYEEVYGVFSRANPVSDREKPGFIEDLTEAYIRYGIATGPQHAMQMIRDFEAQAASQARGGKQPGR